VDLSPPTPHPFDFAQGRLFILSSIEEERKGIAAATTICTAAELYRYPSA
jgi:hypothetical protein